MLTGAPDSVIKAFQIIKVVTISCCRDNTKRQCIYVVLSRCRIVGGDNTIVRQSRVDGPFEPLTLSVDFFHQTKIANKVKHKHVDAAPRLKCLDLSEQYVIKDCTSSREVEWSVCGRINYVAIYRL